MSDDEELDIWSGVHCLAHIQNFLDTSTDGTWCQGNGESLLYLKQVGEGPY